MQPRAGIEISVLTAPLGGQAVEVETVADEAFSGKAGEQRGFFPDLARRQRVEIFFL